MVHLIGFRIIKVSREEERKMSDNRLNFIIRFTDSVIEIIENTSQNEKEKKEMIKYLINELSNELFDE